MCQLLAGMRRTQLCFSCSRVPVAPTHKAGRLVEELCIARDLPIGFGAPEWVGRKIAVTPHGVRAQQRTQDAGVRVHCA